MYDIPIVVIADSLFSLIIFIYVMVTLLHMIIIVIYMINHHWSPLIIICQVTFLYMFYGFCWKEPEKAPPPPPADAEAE